MLPWEAGSRELWLATTCVVVLDLGLLSLLILLVIERCGKMHASGQPERVSIQHRIVWIEKLVRRAKYRTTGISRLASPRSHQWRLTLKSHRVGGVLHGRAVEVGDVGIGVDDLVGVGVFEHVCLGVVLLLCTHGINLGRT